MSLEILSVKNLTKKFDKFIAVDNISLSLKQGEILGLLGPNGAGKTTTIQMLLGILTPTKGEVFYFGKELMNHREQIMETVNYSSTYTTLPWNLTVIECLKFISYFYEIPNRKVRIDEIIKIFRLESLIHEQIKELSAGQLTRVNLAKAFINSPRVLLLDEPTASLDPEVAKYIRDFLLEEREKRGVSMIFTSHNMSEVETVCDRVVFINHGKIIADDTPEKLAKTIEISHLELLVSENLQKLVKFCTDKGHKHNLINKRITIDLNDKKIPQFLREIGEMGVNYDEISIEKASLEDYFLQVTSNQESELR